MKHLHGRERITPPVTFLARDDNYHDILAAIPYAVNAKVPIAITSTKVLNPHTKDYLLNNRKGSKIVIVGGTSAVSSAVEVQLKMLGFKVERLAGRDREETMGLIAQSTRMPSVRLHYRTIQPDEVFGGAITAKTPASHAFFFLDPMPRVDPEACYQAGDMVAALYKRSYEKVWHTS